MVGSAQEPENDQQVMTAKSELRIRFGKLNNNECNIFGNVNK